jgi:hypothetical protein
MAGSAKEVAGIRRSKEPSSLGRAIRLGHHDRSGSQISLNGRKDVDSEVLQWLRKAYEENR